MNRQFALRTLVLLTTAGLIACDNQVESVHSMEIPLPKSEGRVALAEFEELFVELRMNGGDQQLFSRPESGIWNLPVVDVNLDQNNTVDVVWYAVVAGTRHDVATKSESFFADSAAGSAKLEMVYLSGSFDHDGDGVSNLDEINADTFPVVVPELEAIRNPPCFLLGSPETEPGRYNGEAQVQNCLSSYMIGKYEVSFSEYEEFARKTNRPLPDSGGVSEEVLGDRPVVNVKWTEALAYTQWLTDQTGKSYRLPTEAEWEYAARGTTSTAYNTGDSIDRSQANYLVNEGDTEGTTVSIKQFAPNLFGLHNVHGNVFEWTCSPFENMYAGGQNLCVSDPGSRLMVIRGGSWAHGLREIRSANRGWVDTANSPERNGAAFFVGIRIAMDL